MPLSKIPAVSVDATGTPSSSTFFRGDNTWAAPPDSGLGVGQTWTNVTASRVSGTTYTNTTGKPICVSVTGTLAAANGLTLTISGIIVNEGYVSAANTRPIAVGIVPNGETYSVAASPSTIKAWSELR